MSRHMGATQPAITRLGVFGAGASGREVAWLAHECFGPDLPLTFVVDQDDLVGSFQNGIPVMHLDAYANDFPNAPIVVAVGDPAQREGCVQKCLDAGMRFVSLIHPRAEASRLITLGEGTIVCAGVVLTTNITIGKHVHMNIGCTVSHDAQLDDFVTLSPGVHVSGWVHIARGAFLGTGAVVINGSKERRVVIGEKAIVGAGACVIDDVQPRTTVVGVPATRTL